MSRIDPNDAKRLVDTYADLILRISYTYLKSTSDAQDICQTVFLKYLLKNQPFDSPAHEKAWIIRVTINACKDVLKAYANSHRVTLESLGDMAAPPESNAVLDAVMALPSKYRMAVYLYYYEGYTSKEIGRMVGATEGAVNARLSRGRKMLREILGGDYCEA